MNRLARSPEPEKLLEHSGWMKALARRLLADDAGADDVVQDTWLAFWRRPPRDPNAYGSWLRRVVFNLSLRSRRARDTRDRRERRGAKPERSSITPDAMLEQAEMHRLLVETVLGMDEPYRSTVLLRFFGEQTPAQIAVQEEVPVDTVKTRLRRAILHLRRRLDRTEGGRAAWTIALLPLAAGAGAGTSAAAFPEVASPLAAAGPGVIGTGSSSGAASGAAMAGSVLGGTIVAHKALTAAGIVIIALAAGFGIGKLASKPSKEDAKSILGLVEREKLEAAEARLAEAGAEIEKARLALAGSRGETEALAARLKAIDEERRASTAVAPAARSGPRPKAAFSFGKYGGLPEIQDADWDEMADATRRLSEIFFEYFEALAKKEAPDPLLQAKSAAENAKLIKAYLSLVGKIPTNGRERNGELSHPIVTSNLMAAWLRRAQAPFTPEQEQSLARLGVEFESRYDRLQSGYGETTPRLDRIVDELELKQEVTKGIHAMLTEQQRAALVRPEIEGTIGDALSPMMMAYRLGKTLDGASADALRSGIARQLAERFELAPEQVEALGPALDSWLEEVRPHIASSSQREFFTVDLLAAAGRAAVRLQRQILALPDLSDASRRKVAKEETWFVPRIVEPADEAGK